MPVSTEVNGNTATETIIEQVNASKIENSDTVKVEEKTLVKVSEVEPAVNTNGPGESFGSIKFTPLNVDVVDGIDSPMKDEADEVEPPVEQETKTTPKKRGAADQGDDTEKPKKKRTPTKAKKDADSTEGDSPTEVKKKRVTRTKNGKTDTSEETEPTSTKKRVPAKGKTNASEVVEGGVKVEDDDAANGGTPNGNAANGTTPKGRAKKSTTELMTNENGSPKTAPRKRAAPKNSVATPRGIPSSWESASEADKLLVRMKDEGKDWVSIRAAWKAATGEDTAQSTLPNRYNRIKTNMMRLKDGDAELLLTAKAEVESRFQTEKLALIAKALEDAGGDKYPTLFLYRQIKELESRAKSAAAITTATATVARDDDDEDSEE